MPGYPLTQYEYGIGLNSDEPLPVVCTRWNHGTRIYNKQPYFVHSDNPLTGMHYGGFVFYRATDADDDDVCVTSWRHRYWYLDTDNAVSVAGSLGCLSTLGLFCRVR
jgi:hypothetical protein